MPHQLVEGLSKNICQHTKTQRHYLSAGIWLKKRAKKSKKKKKIGIKEYPRHVLKKEHWKEPYNPPKKKSVEIYLFYQIKF